MMRTNTDITVYRRTVVSGSEVYTRSVVYKVAWEDRRGVNARTPGEIKADDVTVYIPFARAISALNAGDILVKGVVTDVISSAFTPTQLRAKYPRQTVVVKTVDSMDMGSFSMRHWQIGAK